MRSMRILLGHACLVGCCAAWLGLRLCGQQAMTMTANSLVAQTLDHATAGTSAEPDSTPIAMFMTQARGWTLMIHGVAFLSDQQQSGPRGFDKLFSTNWIMPMAERSLGPGRLTLRAMFSLEPATITDRRYPELFQVGETAFGRPLVDGQHPHNFFMELAALYDLRLGPQTLLSFYAAPMGDPAIGPTAFPHRASASEDPLAALGHHLEDSTHIAADVATVGLTYRCARLEASAFHGREPDEHRWAIPSGRLDSWSARLSVNPFADWSGQYSWARIASPEALEPTHDQVRMTASLMYNRPLAAGNWASTLLWGRTRDLATGGILNGYLLESTLRFRARNSVWTRIENVDRPNELLLDDEPEPAGFEERFLARVQAYSAGYDRDFAWLPGFATALGAQLTLYRTPPALDRLYGAQPLGAVLFLRIRPH